MTDINTANLIEQMRAMIHQSQGGKPEEVGENSFGNVFQQALSQVSGLNQSADDLTTRFQLGDPNVSLADVMVETQKANIGFQGTLMVRNKVVQAYTDIMNMAV
ncbi:flagellar hook-basal body complex protein FliE [Legionella sp. km772]|uniref:flagellar hook-basal body complex protein FliE n=1 Tax=Legionella sp. km772 TaxID=2498111 RepID=UPI000F8E0D4B|nr:flagellar hook-basal body complex protein FliE [Legionella sp. km772]RUR10541.1 flagellar hook-basal body complex protein FliE [Legionella sp. km772]